MPAGRYYAGVARLLRRSFPGMADVSEAAYSLLSEVPESCLEELVQAD